MTITWLTTYMKNHMTNIRAATRQDSMTVYLLQTGSGGWRKYDAYRRVKPAWVKTPQIFTGALASAPHFLHLFILISL